MLKIALIDPQIPPNTGTIARLCAATRCHLDIVGNIGFDLSDKALKRAGLDYWPEVDWAFHPDADTYLSQWTPSQLHLLTKKSSTPYTQHHFKEDDVLVFGSETKGLSESLRKKYADHCCGIPMMNPAIRSLNLANAASIVLYHALHQLEQF